MGRRNLLVGLRRSRVLAGNRPLDLIAAEPIKDGGKSATDRIRPALKDAGLNEAVDLTDERVIDASNNLLCHTISIAIRNATEREPFRAAHQVPGSLTCAFRRAAHQVPGLSPLR